MDASQEKLISLFHDPAHFTKSYEVFLKYSTFNAKLEGWIDEEFGDVVVDKLAENFPLDQDNGERVIRMLGVGCGSGEIDMGMAVKMLERFPKVHNTAVDPARSQMNKYKHLVKQTTKCDRLQDIEFDFRQQKAEEYLDSRSSDSDKFHFISSVYSLHFVDNFDIVIGRLFDILEDGGILRIDVNAEESGCCSSYQAFPELQDEIRKDLTSKHIEESLSKREMSYQKYDHDITVDLTPLVNDHVDSDLLLDWMSHTKDFRESASFGYYRHFVDFLTSEKCSRVEPNGDVIFDDGGYTYIIQKPLSS